ncbi:ROK family glucokinase [Streptomyces sp. NPDC059459]|uniref:ROK family glucokinase n=1 Tax=Streptomyces sp. NPDC059459 TaxID=3346839 RepID=UPI00368D713D
MPSVIGIDIGGTKIAAGLVDDAGRIVRQTTIPTTATDPEAILEDILAVITDLSHGEDVQAVGIGAAALVSSDRSTILYAPNLAWRNEPLGSLVQQKCGLPTVVENDANAALWAEHRYGVARSVPNAVMITVGTGIGGGILVEGQLRRGPSGLAGEFGHVPLVPDGILCGCGNHGCWETVASGRALVREAQRLARNRPREAATLLDIAGGDWRTIDGPHVMRAAEDGDSLAIAAFDTVGAWIGRGMAAVAAVLDVHTFVLGGGAGTAGELLRAPAQAAITDLITGYGYRPVPDVVLAELGAEAGLIGAADLAR